MLSANAFSLDKANILLSDKGLAKIYFCRHVKVMNPQLLYNGNLLSVDSHSSWFDGRSKKAINT